MPRLNADMLALIRHATGMPTSDARQSCTPHMFLASQSGCPLDSSFVYFCPAFSTILATTKSHYNSMLSFLQSSTCIYMYNSSFCYRQ